MDTTELHGWWRRGGLDAPPASDVVVAGADPVLDCRHRPGEAAGAALGLTAGWAAEVGHRRGGDRQIATIDVGDAAASLVGFAVQSCPGADLSRSTPPYTRFHPTADGRWIHLHGGFPHLATGLVDLLGCAPNEDAVSAAVATWDAVALETAAADAGLCAAVARSADEWDAHPQGAEVAHLDAVTIRWVGEAPPRTRRPAERPLGGVKVADFTRVLAGPTCGRTLAAHGADVVRLASPHLPFVEPYVIETGHGKRSAHVDLDLADDRAALQVLLESADVMVQSYRSGALAARGFGLDDVAELSPGVVHVSINCYGHSGPWARRAGWEQLAQTVSGIAVDEGGDGSPSLLPAAATDYTTGYLAAAGAIMALARQMVEGGTWSVEVSLCQTARWIRSGGLIETGAEPAGLAAANRRLVVTDTVWGPLTHLPPAEALSVTPPRWDLPPSPLGTHRLDWASDDA